MISLNHYRRVAYRGYVGGAEGWIVLAGHNGRVEFVSLEGYNDRVWDYVLEYVECPEGNLFVFDEKPEEVEEIMAEQKYNNYIAYTSDSDAEKGMVVLKRVRRHIKKSGYVRVGTETMKRLKNSFRVPIGRLLVIDEKPEP